MLSACKPCLYCIKTVLSIQLSHHYCIICTVVSLLTSPVTISVLLFFYWTIHSPFCKKCMYNVPELYAPAWVFWEVALDGACFLGSQLVYSFQFESAYFIFNFVIQLSTIFLIRKNTDIDRPLIMGHIFGQRPITNTGSRKANRMTRNDSNISLYISLGGFIIALEDLIMDQIVLCRT